MPWCFTFYTFFSCSRFQLKILLEIFEIFEKFEKFEILEKFEIFEILEITGSHGNVIFFFN